MQICKYALIIGLAAAGEEATGWTFVQSRTYTGAPGTAAAGFTAYEYRIDLRNAHKYTDCIAGAVMTPSSIGADGAINPGI